MSTRLKGLEGTAAVMNDILIYGSNEEEHDRRLKVVLRTIKASGLKLNRAKCHFRQTELQFFGHIISTDGVKPDKSKVEAIIKLPSPMKQLWQVLGHKLCGQILSWPVHHATHSQAYSEKRRHRFGVSLRRRHSAKLCLWQHQHHATTIQASQWWSAQMPAAVAWVVTRPRMQKKDCMACEWACERFASYIQGMGMALRP